MSIMRECEACGEEIHEGGHFGWDGKWYCTIEHMPLRDTPPCVSMTIHTLRLLIARAKGNFRDQITVGDLEWAIQELEK